MRPRRAPLWPALGLMVLIALAVHAASLWALPRLIMHKALQTVGGPQPPAPVRPPLATQTARAIVLPSPDLLYGVCVADLRRQDLAVQVDLRGLPYASVAIYDERSDNIWVMNDRQAIDAPLRLRLQGPDAPPAAKDAAQAVRVPGTRALVLVRFLVTDRQDGLARAEAARQSLRCQAL